MLDNLKTYYTTIFSVAYSNCGNYLVAGNNYGAISIFNLSPFLEENAQLESSQYHPHFILQAHAGPVYSLASTKKFIISGSIGEIKLWKWSDLKRKQTNPIWTLQISPSKNLGQSEINSITLCKKGDSDVIYASVGDKICCIDIEKGSLLFELEGHTNYIHSLDITSNGQQCISASEDGSVQIWDVRKGGSSVLKFHPNEYSGCSRHELGKWIKCVSLDSSDNWFVCGGAPHLSVWNIRHQRPASVLIKPNVTPNVVHFRDDMIISGGTEAFINHWRRDGELEMAVPTSPSTIFSIGIHTDSNKQILVSAGSSYKLDMCSDFRYKNATLLFQ